MSETYPGVEKPVADPDISENLGKRYVKWIAIKLSGAVLHSDVHYEEGAEEEILEHRDAGNPLQILMTHFRRVEPLVIAEIAGKQKTLRHIRYTTGITGKEELFDVPVIGWFIRNGGVQKVSRPIENPNETPEQRALRKERNQQTQALGGRFLASGYNWLIFPEGGSRRTVEQDGQLVRVYREPGVVMPAQNGFVYSLENMTDEERRKVKLLGIAVHYGEGRFSSLHPTVHISRPVPPIDGTREERRQQGEDLLRHGVAEAVRLHEAR
ncbi:MAG TPA: 1-acyl-sn-glycerol-3-phosphate acyltransferase [Candidatus Saccharimonadales bacterium]|nr:1-acyl-sn-glycerol-3-phosphate acyltransferase [Candidatus Saccharimonadales bacterium]